MICDEHKAERYDQIKCSKKKRKNENANLEPLEESQRESEHIGNIWDTLHRRRFR